MNLASEHSFTGGFCCPSVSTVNPHDTSKKGKEFDPLVAELIAENLNGLSLDEREQIMEDIHCVGEISKEEESYVTKCLNSLEEELRNVRGTSREAFDLAMRMDPRYVQNRDFRLKFLRADEFDVPKAARRMIDHFATKLQFFGENKLVKDITYDDLSSEDRRALYAGNQQFLGEKDCKGRTLMFAFPEFNVECSFESFFRARWYQWMGVLEEESAQVNGIVIVCWWTTRSILCNANIRANELITKSMPFRVTAFHHCFVNQTMPIYIRALLDALGKRFQTRSRFHLEESSLKCLYTLQSFGIDPAIVPIGTDGLPTKELFLELIEKRKLLEERQSNKDNRWNNKNNNNNNSSNNNNNNRTFNNEQTLLKDSVIPMPHDILLGRGTRTNSHQGNIVLERMIEMEAGLYQQAMNKFEKTCIVLAMTKRIEASGGRFLIRNMKNREWYVADDNAIRESLSARYRNKVKKRNAAAAASTTMTGTTLRSRFYDHQQLTVN